MTIDFDFILRRNAGTHSQHYPNSYYAASADSKTGYQTLSEHISVDVCVIGGGFSGINTAIELAERGFKVAVLEARRIGWGASGRNGGQLLRGIGQDIDKFRRVLGSEGVDMLYRMGDEANEIAKARIKKYRIDCDLKKGSSALAIKKRHLDELKQSADDLAKHNYPYEMDLVLDANKMATVIGSKRYIGALTLAGDAHLHPLKLCLGEAKAAAQLGVAIYENSPATAIKKGKKISVSTTNGLVSADYLVMCGNAYVSNMDKKITTKILPAGSYIIATKPLDNNLASELLPKDSAVCDLNYALDYYRLSQDKRLLFGAMCNYSGLDPKDIRTTLRKKMLRVFPQLSKVDIEYAWGGMIGVGLNRLPQIGRTHPNVYYAQGYAGHGVNATHLAAKVIAESISQQSQRIDVFERVKHLSFPGGKWLQSYLFALGMIYFRLKDHL